MRSSPARSRSSANGHEVGGDETTTTLGRAHCASRPLLLVSIVYVDEYAWHGPKEMCAGAEEIRDRDAETETERRQDMSIRPLRDKRGRLSEKETETLASDGRTHLSGKSSIDRVTVGHLIERRMAASHEAAEETRA